MRLGQLRSRNRTGVSVGKVGHPLRCALAALVIALGAITLSGCAGLVSGSSTTNNTVPPSLQITNVQVTVATTSSCQIAWTTSVPADSAVDYGVSSSYGSATPVDSTMATTHQVTVSGLAAGTTYYYQVLSTDSNSNHGKSGGHNFKTLGFSMSGTVSPATGGNGATLTLSGAASATATADSSGNYSFAGLANGGYMVVPSHAGYTFSPASQSVSVNGANATGVNFTDAAQTFSISGAISPTTGGAGATVALSGATSATTTADASGAYTFTSLVSGSYTVTPNHAGYVFSPVSQGVTVSAANVTGVNFTDSSTALAPTITTQPANQTVTAGQTATFTVVAAGTAPLSYQWRKNGANISGATAASYTTPATATSDSGSSFTVMVSNSAGTVTSAGATLTVNAAPAPAIQVNPTAINFANVVVGANLSQALIIKNTGTATLTISQVSATGSGFSVSGFSLPFSVNAGQQTTITVAFIPTVVGSASGNVSIVSNAPTSPTSVGLTGTAIAATFTLGISPSSLSFGNVTTGTSSPAQNILISNTGNSAVTISQITLSGTGYSMTGGGAPVTLNPTQSITLSVQLSPTVTGTSNGGVSVVSNATGSPASVSLTGTGVAPSQHSVALSWTASTSAVVGYNVYRGTVSGGPYTKINSSVIAATNYTDSTVQSGTTYYYVATAVDASGNESVYSNEVQAVVP